MLKCLYHLGEADEKPFGLRSASEMQSQRHFKAGKLQNGLRRLRREGLIRKENEKVALTEDGLKAGRRVVRIHRLWELYLTTYLQLPADHVHEDAEAIEHIITPELERELEARLRRPGLDPHKSNIPYEETD
jgi:manganese/zinc/iron transport system permease protein